MDKRGIGSGERPLLAITMGDAAGIGPEIIVKALARPEVLEMCRPLVIGDVAIMENHLRFWPGNGASGNDAVASVRPTVRRVASPELVSDVALGDIPVFQPGEALAGVEPGKLSAEGGRGRGRICEGSNGSGPGRAHRRHRHGAAQQRSNAFSRL